jgi:hypothetical protein
MTAPKIPLVLEILRANPNGAYGWQIAGELDVTDTSIGQTLLLMLGRYQVVLAEQGKSRSDSLWRLANPEDGGTPPIFRAMETLRGMQEAARQRLVKQPMLEAA